MNKFEYTVLEVPLKGFWGSKVDYAALTSKLNDLGKKGWEAISGINTTLHQGASGAVIIILKRELPN
ncbi:MAG TPA: DUF4177 domain-containing protein [Flavisolibacter sp.]|jgi:hypothetical protein|nr:DUF4177 domain-containing protein [Flavisolibacter sp.]